MSDTFEYDLVCIGSGPAGQRAAIQAAKLDKRVALIEKQRRFGAVGGASGLPQRTLREAVRAFNVTIGGARFAGARPDVAALAARVEAVVAHEVARIEETLRKNDVELIRGEARFEDARRLAIDGPLGRREITARNVLIAVGTRAGATPGVTIDGRICVDTESLAAQGELPATVAVIGCGATGIEFGSTYAALGAAVTFVDRSERPLGFLDDAIAAELRRALEARGARFLLGDAAVGAGVVQDPGATRGELRLASGRTLRCDRLFFATGRVGDAASLGLAEIGLAVDERGRLAVDASFRTAVEGIYAAGEIAARCESASESSEQGRLAACRMFGAQAADLGRHAPTAVYSIPEVAGVGETEQALVARGARYVAGLARREEIARGAISGDSEGLFKMLFDAPGGRLLGVHCAGTGAAELVHVGQAVLSLGGGLDYFLDGVFNYPTLAECYKVAALDASNRLRGAAAAR